MDLLERVMAVRMGGGVERCHTVKHFGSYSNAAHSWGVAALMYILFPGDFPRLAPYCIFHDVPEAWVGDIPAPVKKFDPSVKTATNKMERFIFDRLQLPNDADLSEGDKNKLKACDILELYLWSKEQVAAGNKHAHTISLELEGFVNRDGMVPEAAYLFKLLKDGGDVTYRLFDLYREVFPRS